MTSLEMDGFNESSVANRKERGVQNRLVVRKPPPVRSRWFDDPNCVRLVIMLGLTTSYFVVELVWGLAVGSLALVADAMHMFSDIIGMGIGLYSLRVAKRPPSLSATYGWIRMEVIGGLTNAAFLMGISFIIILDSIARFFEANNETLQNSGTNVLIVGGVGLGINLIGLFVLSSGHGHSHGSAEAENTESHSHSNINVHGVLLHVAGDALGSVAVIVSGIAIRFSDSDQRVLADPICSLFISLLICFSAVPLMRRCISVLLQQAPLHINMSALEVELRRVPTVMDLHELHVWQLTPERIVGSVHVLFHEHISSEAIASIKVAFHAHGVHATTIQTEVFSGQVGAKAQETFLCEEPVCEEDCTTKSCCVHAA